MKLSTARSIHLYVVTRRVGLYAAIFFEGFPLQSLTVIFKMFKKGIVDYAVSIR